MIDKILSVFGFLTKQLTFQLLFLLLSILGQVKTRFLIEKVGIFILQTMSMPDILTSQTDPSTEYKVLSSNYR